MDVILAVLRSSPGGFHCDSTVMAAPALTRPVTDTTWRARLCTPVRQIDSRNLVIRHDFLPATNNALRKN